MSQKELQQKIESYWENKDSLNLTDVDLRSNVDEVLNLLDAGKIRVSEKKNGIWEANQWIKKAILLSFKTKDNSIFSSGTSNLRRGQYTWFDKVNLKTSGWVEDEWTKRNFRSVPGAIIRHSSYIAENAAMIPSLVTLGAHIDSGSQPDTWATVGTCAQIGKNVHLSGGAGIGGVLEPLQANPVIIEDYCFIGARSEIAEGVIVEEGSVISMGVYIGASTKIINRESGEVLFGKVPPYSVVVPGSVKSEKGDINLYCAVIVKQVDQKTRSKTSINELLRS